MNSQTKLLTFALTLAMQVVCVFAMAQVEDTNPRQNVSGFNWNDGSDHLPANTQPSQYAELSTSISESVESLEVQEGDFVKKGQLLVVLNKGVPAAQASLAKLAAESTGKRDEAQLEVKATGSKVVRIKAALKKGSSNKLELDRAIVEYEKAKARLKAQEDLLNQAAEQYKLAKEQLNSYMIRAPFAGQVTKVHFREGSFVTAATPVIELMNSRRLKVELHLPLKFWGKLKRGTQYKLSVGEPASKFVMGNITHSSKVVDAASKTFRVVFEIENASNRLPVGIPVKLSVKVAENHVASR